MQFTSDKKKPLRVSIHARDIKRTLANLYETPFNVYSLPPQGTITMAEAEALVEERLTILRCFDDANAQGFADEDFHIDGAGIRGRIHRVVGKLKYQGATDENKDLYGNNFYDCSYLSLSIGSREARERDHISHFLLRLYCCCDDEMRKWFLWHETKLLHFRLMEAHRRNQFNSFLEDQGLGYERVENLYNPSDFSNPVAQWFESKSRFKASALHIYRFPFEEALDVVRSRQGYLKDGFIYVSGYELIRVITTQFRIELSKALSTMAFNLPKLEEKDRLIPILSGVHYELVTKVDNAKKAAKAGGNRERVTPEMVDRLSELFPPCMKATHFTLRKKHHLKHYGRIHYSLFLKSLGMEVEDAIEFFKKEFTKTIAPEKFAKEYTYNIRYNYGLEGKKTSLSAFGCNKIINQNPPGPEDSHGCPFKYFDVKKLKELLKTYKVSDEAIDSIVAVTKERNYTGACTQLFCSMYPKYDVSSENAAIYHPNQFYAEAKRLHPFSNSYSITRHLAAKSEQPASQAEEQWNEEEMLDNTQLDALVSALGKDDEEQTNQVIVKKETVEPPSQGSPGVEQPAQEATEAQVVDQMETEQ